MTAAEYSLNKENLIKELNNILSHLDDLDFLNLNELHEAKITLNTLIEITNQVHSLSKINHLYFLKVQVGDKQESVPIHLREYHGHKISDADRIELILNALPRAFVTSYNVVKSTPKFLQNFLIKLNGYCIDGRTRLAFDYAERCGQPNTFCETIEACSREIKEAHHEEKVEEGEINFYHVFLQLLNTHWNTPYKKDLAASSFCQEDGIFNFDKFDVLYQYLNSIYIYDENESFLGYFDKCIDEHKITYLHFALFSSAKEKDLRNFLLAYRHLTTAYTNHNGKILKDLKQAEAIIMTVIAFSKKNLDRAYLEINDLITKVVTHINRACDRWYPLRWEKNEIEQLYSFFTNKTISSFLAGKFEATTLRSITKRIYSLKNQSEIINWHLSLDKLKLLQDHGVLLKLVPDSLRNTAAKEMKELYLIYQLNANRKDKNSTQHLLYQLAAQNKDIDVALLAFKRYTKTCKDLQEKYNEATYIPLIQSDKQPTNCYFKKLEKFLSSIPSLGLNDERAEGITSLIVQAIPLQTCILSYITFTEEDKQLVYTLFTKHANTFKPYFIQTSSESEKKLVADLLFEVADSLKQQGAEPEKIIQAYNLSSNFGNVTSTLHKALFLINQYNNDDNSVLIALTSISDNLSFASNQEQAQTVRSIAGIIFSPNKALSTKAANIITEYYLRTREIDAEDKIIIDNLIAKITIAQPNLSLKLLRKLSLFIKNPVDFYQEIPRKVNFILDLSQENDTLRKIQYNDKIIPAIRLVANKYHQFNLSQTQSEARSAIRSLITSLTDHYQQYFILRSIDANTFQSCTIAAINKARPVLEKHRGWKQFVGNLFLIVLTGGIGFLLLSVANKLINNRFLFFNETDSAKHLNTLEKAVTLMA